MTDLLERDFALSIVRRPFERCFAFATGVTA